MKTKSKIGALLLGVLPVLVLLSSCGSTATLTGGYADKATIVIAAKKEYVGVKVSLYVDGQVVKQDIAAVKESKATRTAPRFEVSPGTHDVSVVGENGIELHRAKIFLSSGKSKVIVLP